MPTRRTAARTSATITVDGIEVLIARKRVRNVNLRVRRDGTVCVSAPSHVSEADIARFVASRIAWIQTAQARVAQQRQTVIVSCDEGEELLLWGKSLTCHVAEGYDGPSRRSIEFSTAGELLVVHTGPHGEADAEAMRARRTRQLEAWLKEQLRAEAEALLPHLETTVGVRFQELRLRAMTSRWGSCNVRTAVITLNTQLVHYDRRCLAYVLTHELCHLHEPSHNARFHALMDRFYPDWRTVRALLNGRTE